MNVTSLLVTRPDGTQTWADYDATARVWRVELGIATLPVSPGQTPLEVLRSLPGFHLDHPCRCVVQYKRVERSV